MTVADRLPKAYDDEIAMSAVSTEIFSRVVQPERGSFSPELARFVLNLDFRGEDHTRYEELSGKARDGTLTTQEGNELDEYLRVDSLLAILRLKAERSLQP